MDVGSRPEHGQRHIQPAWLRRLGPEDSIPSPQPLPWIITVCSSRTNLIRHPTDVNGRGNGRPIISANVSLTAGSRLGPYEILSPLGAGGMGEVWKARDTRLKREVAIKVLPSSFAADADRLRRFEQEAQAAGALNHPNITAVYDIGMHDGTRTRDLRRDRPAF